MGREFAKMLIKAESEPFPCAVSGPNSAKTRQFLLEALAAGTSKLPNLQLVFIGNETDSQAVRAAVEGRGGEFFFEPAD
jgi:hypothetical protein